MERNYNQLADFKNTLRYLGLEGLYSVFYLNKFLLKYVNRF
jgi:hypothetical protein